MQNFLIAFAVSFIGSIPLGSLNLTALQIYLQHSIKPVIYFSFSAGIVELFYSYFALRGEIFLQENSYLNQIFSYITILAFITLGIINWRTKSKPIVKNNLAALDNTYYSKLKSFKKGLILSILNPQAIPFWLVLSNFLEKQELVAFHYPVDTFYYSFGVASGTFTCLFSFSLIAGKFLKKREIRMDLFNKTIGTIFLGIGFFQIWKIFSI